jgi:hypothetical protein
MDARKQLQVIPEREPLTMGEAVRIGSSASRLARYRHLLKEALKPTTGSIVVGSGYTAQSQALGSTEVQAALSFLIEREELFLASFNVQIERPNA